jgi:hypothetical protein
MVKYLVAILLAVSSVASYSQHQQLASSVALSVGKWLIKDHRHVYYVRVESTGRDFEDAKNKAFRTAIELAVGAIVVGESEVRDNRLVKNDTISYSSGQVHDFKVVSSNGNKIVMDVWVSKDSLADRIEAVVATSADGNIDTKKIEEAFKQAEKRQQLDDANNRAAWDQTVASTRMMLNILDDYPRAAFVTKLDNTKLLRDAKNGMPYMEYTVDINWNPKYVEALTKSMLASRNGVALRGSGHHVQVWTGIYSWTNGMWDHDSQRVNSHWQKTFEKNGILVLQFPSGLNLCTTIATQTEFIEYPINYGIKNVIRVFTNRTVTKKLYVFPENGQSPSDFAHQVKGPIKMKIVENTNPDNFRNFDEYCQRQ